MKLTAKSFDTETLASLRQPIKIASLRSKRKVLATELSNLTFTDSSTSIMYLSGFGFFDRKLEEED